MKKRLINESSSNHRLLIEARETNTNIKHLITNYWLHNSNLLFVLTFVYISFQFNITINSIWHTSFRFTL